MCVCVCVRALARVRVSVRVLVRVDFVSRAVVLNLGSVSQSQGFGGGQDTHPTHMIRDDTPRFAVNIHYYVFVFV